MSPEIVAAVVGEWGLALESLSRPSNACLTPVYFVNDRFVCRSRAHAPSSLDELARERTLLDRLRPLVRFALPQCLPTPGGEICVLRHDRLWTVYPMIAGRPPGNWFELHLAEPGLERRVLAQLGELHRSTRGRLDPLEPVGDRLFRLAGAAREAVGHLLGRATRARLDRAFERARALLEGPGASELVFVHGDFHPGNLLIDERRVTGLLDLDWCRAGHPLEDLGFTAMMLVRDYQTWDPAFRPERLAAVVQAYGGASEGVEDFFLLYALFDCQVFREADFPGAERFAAYQLEFLESAAQRLA